ncbi:MAG: GH92 family glycosyl hydrolase, partial [Asticcacaulis sp.]|nr:GH92 family glycosyl hydrolase [Asticcacaulis sp.]
SNGDVLVADAVVKHLGGFDLNQAYEAVRKDGEVNPRNLSFPRGHETASPGYYAMALGDIQVELTATRMVAVERYGFPEGRTGNILLDVTSAVQLGGGGPRATSAHAEVALDGSLSGQASFVGGWNGSPYTLYFYAIFDRCPIETGTWTAAQGASHVAPGNKVVDGGNQSASLANRLGLYARFDPAQGPVTMKLAVSFVSVAAAKAHLNAEAAADFGQIRGAAGAQWKQVLGQIEAEGGTPAQRRQFFSALYRVHTMPHDVSGDNPWWTSTEPHYEDFYTLWDTFRGVHPLLTLIQPQRQRDMVRSLLDTYQHTGWLPDARIAGATGLTQGGSNGDVLVADAVVKHLGGFDLNQAYEAVRKDGEVDSPESLNFGRDLKDYAALGYVSLTATRSASRTMEYAYDDFAIAQVARAAGHGDAADRFVKRSYSWRNLWDKDTQCIRPRYADGAWLENFVCGYRYPDATTPWWDAPYYEGSGYQYSTYVPHDVRTLMAYTGGRDGFVAWLDRFFVGDYDQGNEPDILAPYLYINAGRPDRTADRVRRILSDNYQPTHGGLPGNDDAGAMSAWYVWGAIGLYPNAGQPWYYIGS